MISKTSLPFNGTTASDLAGAGHYLVGNKDGANETMVGGSHYHQGDKGFQHWDLVIANRLGYFEGQITRYVSRARYKTGLEDLRKALHYVLKLKEQYQVKVGGFFGFFESPLYPPQHETGMAAYKNVLRFCRQQDLTAHETNAMLMACQWLNLQDLLVLESIVFELVRAAENLETGTVRKPTAIHLTKAEIQSGMDRVRWAEGLIKQLPEDHEGRNSWLLNYGRDNPLGYAAKHKEVGKTRVLYGATTDRVIVDHGSEPDRSYVCQDPDMHPAPRPHPNDTLYQVHPDSQQ